MGSNVQPFGIKPSTTIAVSASGLKLGTFGNNPPVLPSNNGGFGFCGGPPRPVERHPETGRPLQGQWSACGGIQNSHPGSSQNQNMGGGLLGGFKPAEDKKKHIQNIYIKLAEARTKIAELNKFIDEIYETLPKIQ
jgi:hypothetical protein